MSFFDDVEETRVDPPTAETPRRPARGGGGRRPPGGGRRPPGGRGRPPRGGGRRGVDEQAIRLRRGVALVAIVIFVILVVVGVHSCQVSQANSALRNYSDSVASLIRASDQAGGRFFSVLSSGSGASNATSLQSQVDEARLTADGQLNQAENLSAPGPVQAAQEDIVLTLRMRRDGIAHVAQDLQPALQSSTATDALNSIAAEMARLYASDVVYKDYALPAIVSALHGAGIAVGGTNGVPVEAGQFLPDVQWLTSSYVASKLNVSVASSTSNSGKPPAPGSHGHALNSCAVGSTTLDPSAGATLPAGSPPTLTCTVTNDGQNTETNVVVKASVGGTSITGQGVIPQTQAGQQYTVQIPLSAAPPAGTYQLTVTVQKVPGETITTHNTKVFPITIQ